MRRFLAVAMIGLYLVLNLGLNLNAHFCMGDLKSVSLSSKPDKCCCDSEGINQTCCSDKVFFIQMDNDDKEVSSFRLAIGKFQFFLTDTSIIDKVAQHQTGITSIEQRRAPPPKQPLWLRNCSLTYYG